MNIKNLSSHINLVCNNTLLSYMNHTRHPKEKVKKKKWNERKKKVCVFHWSLCHVFILKLAKLEDFVWCFGHEFSIELERVVFSPKVDILLSKVFSFLFFINWSKGGWVGGWVRFFPSQLYCITEHSTQYCSHGWVLCSTHSVCWLEIQHGICVLNKVDIYLAVLLCFQIKA